MPTIRRRQVQQPYPPIQQPLAVAIVRPIRRYGMRHPGLTRAEDGGMPADLKPGIHQHAHRLALCRHVAHRQRGIVGQHGTAAREDGAGPGPPGMAVGARRLPRDPLAFAIRQGDETIQRGGRLQAHPGSAPLHPRDEPLIQRPGLFLQKPTANIDAGGPQSPQPLPVDQRVGVFHGRHHARHAGLDQAVGTGPSPSVVGTGFERDIGGCATRPLAGLLQRQHFGMGLAGPPVPAFAHHLAIPHDDAAHARVGHGGIDALPGQVDGPLHGPAIVFGVHVSFSS